MEEARQHSALTSLQRLLFVLLVGSLVVFVASILALVFVSGFAFKLGLLTFLWLRVGVEVVRATLARQQGEKLTWFVISIVLHAAAALFCTHVFDLW